MKMRAFSRCAGSAPAYRSCTNSSRDLACSRKSAHSSSNCSGVIALLLSHQTAFSVVASRTVYLSCAERPVWAPVSTANAPVDAKLAFAPADGQLDQLRLAGVVVDLGRGSSVGELSIVICQPLLDITPDDCPARAGTAIDLPCRCGRSGSKMSYSWISCVTLSELVVPTSLAISLFRQMRCAGQPAIAASRSSQHANRDRGDGAASG